MNLFHLLSNLPHEQLQRLAEEFGVSLLTPSKRNILREITVRYRDHRFLGRLLEELPPSCGGFLRALIFFTPESDSEISVPDTVQSSWCMYVPMQEHIDMLCARGLLFRDARDEERFILPLELRRQLRSLFLSQCQPLTVLKRVEEGEIHPRERYLESIYHLLSLLRRIRARMTQKGTIHKKVYERWEERLGGMEANEEAFDFAFEFCSARGLLQQSRHHRYATAKFAGEWFAKSPFEMRKELWEFLVHQKILSDADFQKLMVILYSMEERVREASSYPVFSLYELEQEFRRQGRAEDALHPTTYATLQRKLETLEAIGLVFFDTYEEEPVFGFTPRGAHLFFDSSYEEGEAVHAGCILQPSFQILVPPHVGYGLLWKLDYIAEFKQRDVMTEFVITQKSVVEALRSGFSREEILPFLESVCEGEIPENVRYSVGEWCGKYGQITFSRTVLMECVSEELANEILHIPEVKEMVRERLSGRHFTLAESHARELLKRLQEYGYEPSSSHKLIEDER